MNGDKGIEIEIHGKYLANRQAGALFGAVDPNQTESTSGQDYRNARISILNQKASTPRVDKLH
jgi:hypothetical protein